MLMGEVALMIRETMTMVGDDDGNCGDVDCRNDEVMRIVLMLVPIMR